ncbi:MAG TPA: TonB-dependent receptor [Chitinophagales bacterium]|nr:TonB-dependent receptor [Chitinophagales bacterium]
MRKSILSLLLIIACCISQAQFYAIKGTVENETGTPVAGVAVSIEKLNTKKYTDSLGNFSIANLSPGTYRVTFKNLLFERNAVEVIVKDKDVNIGPIKLVPFVKELSTVTVDGNQGSFGVTRLKAVEGTAIYDGKKNEVIVMKDMNVSLATNSSRQIFSKVPGINIWESDAAGLQLGIATRGLDPNRTSNFNTRQNGYDMSADALGYPESYYVPPAEAVDRIEVVRGAASLQYGPQFGGMVNYVLQRPPPDKKIEWTSYTTAGAYKLVSTFNSIGGSVNCFHYYGYYNYKQGDSWRPNAAYKLHNAFASLGYQCTERLMINAEYTFSKYITQQAGGLTDAQFEQNARQSLRRRNWFATNWNIIALNLNYKHNAFHQVNVRVWGFIGSRSAAGYLGPTNRTDDETRNRDLIKDSYRNIGAEARYVWKYYIKKNLSSLLVGGRFYRGETKKAQGFTDNSREANFDFVSDSLVGSDYSFPGMNIALFAENVFNIGNLVKITPGIRYEHISTKANGYYKQIANDIVDTTRTYEQRAFNRNFVLLGLGVSYHVWKNTELYANFSQNYRGITFTDMRVVRTSQVINPALRDETGFNVDLGYRGNINNWFNFDVSAFWLQYTNRIGQIQMADSAYNIYRYTTNVGSTRSFGVELFAEADVFHAAAISKRSGNLVLFVSMGYTHATYIKSEYKSVIGKSLEFAPQLNVRGGITYRYKKFSTTINAAFTSQQFTDATNAKFTASAVNGVIPAYYVMDWSAKYSIKCVQLQAGINNFTNNIYYTRRAISYPGPGIIPAEPLTFYFTLGIKLNELVKQNKFNTF